ncbi:LacI family DNA-binding transcriptional regulator [Roseateles sp. DC23W]|uniref:LacI family DNA-binding transcriptional regulator n=1 Tax=Pelomonas dachongensis TaxID=3299029 RepID=A0ABW7EJ29_9BURK
MAPPPPLLLPDLRARLHDVAREAGVSLATVDRALNHRPGVSPRTLQRVQEAVTRLTQRHHDPAMPLPRGGGWLLCFLLPAGQNCFVDQLREALHALTPWLAEQRARVEIRTTDAFSPAAASAAVRRLRGQYDAVVLMLQDHPLVREAVERMAFDGTSVVTLVSDIAARARSHFVGIDNRAAGRTAGALLGRFVGACRGPVGIVMGSHSLQDHAQRLHGFQHAMAAEHPQLQLLPPLECKDRPEAAQPLAAALLAQQPRLVGLYSIGAGNDGIHQALKTSGAAGRLAWVCHELTPHTRAALLDGSASAVIGQSAMQEARAACRLALARLTRQRELADVEPIRIEIYLKDNLP